VAVFDADSVPEPDVLIKVAKYFDDPSVAAVQGTTPIFNADENMLTKFISCEKAVWLKIYLQGKDALDLFVPIAGSCQFIRRDVAAKVSN
jgi:cellulose synthase/poly-beta-1,6-N-acetylglucosamine synthase-like glycosyltransferase